MNRSRKAASAPALDMGRLFGFNRVAADAAALESAIGVAFNKRGTEGAKTLRSRTLTEGVPGCAQNTEGPAAKFLTETVPN